MEDYNDLLKQSLSYKHARDQKYNELSKDRLYQISKKKIQTTMIGALSSLEANFGFLWGIGEPDDEITPEQLALKEIFEQVRSEILDRGNTQIRNLEAEISNYDINWKRYTINLPVVEKGEENE